MTATLFRSCDAIITSASVPVRRDCDLLVEGGIIKAIGPDLSRDAPADCAVIDGTGLFLYPGLVNTHHHFFQCFVRNRAELDWTRYSVIEWLDRIYPIFSRLTEDCFYHSSVVAMAELIKHGCTTAFDHQYCFPRHAGSRIIDRQFEAAEMMGMRFHADAAATLCLSPKAAPFPMKCLKLRQNSLAIANG